MWIIIAAACTSFDMTSCVPMIWKEKSFLTLEACEERRTAISSVLPPDAIYLLARCVEVPGQVTL